jgi:hypothetical protein
MTIKQDFIKLFKEDPMFESFAGCAFPVELTEDVVNRTDDYSLIAIWNDFQDSLREMALEENYLHYYDANGNKVYKNEDDDI